MEKKKILIFTDWFIPGYKAGGPIQSCKNLVQLLKNEYSIYVITSDRDFKDELPYNNIDIDKWVTIDSDINVFYSSPNTISIKFLKQTMSNLQPDFVYLNSMFSVQYTILPLIAISLININTKIILAPRGMLHKGALQFKYYKKKIFLRLFKVLGWSKKIHFHATDMQEKTDILKNFPSSDVSVIQNIPNVPSNSENQLNKIAGELKLVFISRISPKKNLHSVIEWLTTNELEFNWSLDIYGGIEDERYFEKCINLIKGYPISFKGSIENDKVQHVLKQYHCFVLLTLGENFGHAIYESLSVGVPIVVSQFTPWRNLMEQKAGFDISINDSGEFVQTVKLIASMDNDEFIVWQKGALTLAQNYLQDADYFNYYKKIFS